MSSFRQVWLYLGNAALGVVSCYLYIYFWVAFSMGNGSGILSLKAFGSALISIPLFLLWNWIMLRQYSKTYWIHSLAIYIGTVFVFIIIIQVM